MNGQRELAMGLIESIDRNLRKWIGWFPDPRSEISVPRDELLALKRYAEIGLKIECCTNCGQPLDENLCGRCGLAFRRATHGT